MSPDMKRDSIMANVLCGRNTRELIEEITRCGNIARPGYLRGRSLWRGGVKKGADRAENVVFFGCMPPFSKTSELRSALDLLSELGIPYTYMDDEYCCGVPLEETAAEADAAAASAASRHFTELNVAMAKELGAKNIIYYCIWCAYQGKKYCDASGISQRYFPDLVMEKLADKRLRVSPQTIGYYEGCHSRNRGFAPGIELDWKGYRSFLGRIEGLKVVELNSKICCVARPKAIVTRAQELGVNSMVCSCTNCYMRLSQVSRPELPVKYYVDLLAEAYRTGRER